MRKASYKIEVKARCRRRLLHFVQKHFDRRERPNLRVLCFPGPEALEIFEVYDQVGVSRSNIVCLERDAVARSALDALRLGCQIRGEELSKFIEDPIGGPFDVVSLDFTGQLATYEGDVRRAVECGLLAPKAVVFTNFCAAREADASKGYYLARTVSEGFGLDGFAKMVAAGRAVADDPGTQHTRELVGLLEDHLDTLPAFEKATELRDDAIHLEIRNALRASNERSLVARLSPGLAEELAEQTASVWASLDEQIESLPAGSRSRESLEQLRAHNRRKSDSIPAPVVWRRNEILTDMFEDLVEQVAGDRCGPDLRRVANLLRKSCVFAVGPAWVTFDAASFRYVSDKGIPMDADMFALKQFGDFCFLRRYLNLDGATVEEVVAPLAHVDFKTLRQLVEECVLAGKRLAAVDERPNPKRMFLGAESSVGAGMPSDSPEPCPRQQALRILADRSTTSCHEVAARVGASPEQVAAWKAHRTMGTYRRKG